MKKKLPPFYMRFSVVREIGFFVALGILGGVLFANRFYYAVPVFDFFGLMAEGKAYAQFSLPVKVHNPPLYPLMFVSLAQVIGGVYPEITAGILINIGLFLVSLYLVWRIIRKIDAGAAVCVVVLVATNPLTLSLVLQPLNTMLFVTFLLAAVLVWRADLRMVLYGMAFVSYFVKHEAVLLFIAIGLVEYVFLRRRLGRLFWLVSCAVGPVLVWESIIYFSRKVENQYIVEITRSVWTGPNWGFAYDTFIRAPFLGLYEIHPVLALFAFCCSVLGIVLLWRNKAEYKVAAVFIGLYTVLHILLVGDAKRYAYPIFWILYGGLCYYAISVRSLKHKNIYSSLLYKCMVLMVVAIAISNLFSVSSYLSVEKYKGYEHKLTALWLQELAIAKPTLVVIINPEITRYYVSDSFIGFFDFDLYRCGSVACGLKEYAKQQPYDMLFVYDTFSATSAYERNYYKPLREAMEEFKRTQSAYLQPIRSFAAQNNTIELYRYTGALRQSL